MKTAELNLLHIPVWKSLPQQAMKWSISLLNSF